MNQEQEPKPEKKKRAKPFAAKRQSKLALEAEGWTVGDVEQQVPHCFFKRDLWNFADLICASPTRGIMLVQATGSTGGGNFSDHVKKVKAEPRAAIWLASGGRIQIHCWYKRAGTKERECRVLEIVSEKAHEAAQEA